MAEWAGVLGCSTRMTTHKGRAHFETAALSEVWMMFSVVSCWEDRPGMEAMAAAVQACSWTPTGKHANLMKEASVMLKQEEAGMGTNRLFPAALEPLSPCHMHIAIRVLCHPWQARTLHYGLIVQTQRPLICVLTWTVFSVAAFGDHEPPVWLQHELFLKVSFILCCTHADDVLHGVLHLL